jgi:ubiquinone/menaquinone biosynthesis C-methylase UbiE
MTSHGKMESYQKLSTEVYELTKPEPMEEVWPYYLGRAERAGGPILEPMCGSGRYLIPLLERDYDIDGLDPSPDMLKACRNKCAAKGLTPTLYQQFLHEMKVSRQYALVFIPAASFGLITRDDEIKASLQNIYGAMLPGAKLVLEVETPLNKPKEFGRWWGGYHERPDGAKIVHSGFDQSYDDEKNILYSLGKYELIKDGQLLETEWESFILRFWGLDAFASLLAQAGFADIRRVKIWGKVEDREPDKDDPQVAFECVRPD